MGSSVGVGVGAVVDVSNVNGNDGGGDGNLSGGEGVGAVRLPSSNISAYIHLDRLYSESPFDPAQQQHDQYQLGQYR